MRLNMTIALIGLACLPLPSGLAQDDAPPVPPEEKELRAWIEELGSEELTLAREADRKLRAHYPHSRTALLKGLRHERARVRWQVVRILTETRDERNFSALERRVTADRSAAVRIAALKGLSRASQFPIVPLLAERVQWESNPANRRTILRICARVGDRELVGPLLATLATSPDRVFIARAYDTLRDITGASLPDDPAPWRTWWDAYQATKKGQVGR
jgi:hypothetical protein